MNTGLSSSLVVTRPHITPITHDERVAVAQAFVSGKIA
jgi:hypothetical protein